MDIKFVDGNDSQQKQALTRDTDRPAASKKNSGNIKKPMEIDDRVTLKSSGSEGNATGAGQVLVYTRNMIVADARSSLLAIGSLDADRVAMLLQ